MDFFFLLVFSSAPETCRGKRSFSCFAVNIKTNKKSFAIIATYNGYSERLARCYACY